MKKYLILSDSHGMENRLISAVYDHSDATAVIFLGDGMSDLACAKLMYPNLTYYAVKGNCDWCNDLYHGIYCPEEQVITLEGHKLFLTHGHMYGAKFSTESLLRRALVLDCEAVLFGHSHIPLDVYGKADADAPLCHLFNPGSLGRPYCGEPSYGLLQISEKDGLIFSHGSL